MTGLKGGKCVFVWTGVFGLCVFTILKALLPQLNIQPHAISFQNKDALMQTSRPLRNDRLSLFYNLWNVHTWFAVNRDNETKTICLQETRIKQIFPLSGRSCPRWHGPMRSASVTHMGSGVSVMHLNATLICPAHRRWETKEDVVP